MAVYFASSRNESSGNGSAKWLYVPEVSPARKAIERYFSFLRSPDDAVWLSVCGPCGWTDVQRKLSAFTLWICIGSLFHRFVRPFNVWPFRLARLMSDFTSEAERAREAALFLTSEHKCCFDHGFGWHIRQKAGISRPGVRHKVQARTQHNFLACVIELLCAFSMCLVEHFSRQFGAPAFRHDMLKTGHTLG
jgi:hypothetical protein